MTETQTNGIIPVAEQQAMIVVKGKSMSIFSAAQQIMSMPASERLHAVTLAHARVLAQILGWKVVDGAGGTILFLGTPEEYANRMGKVAHPLRAPRVRQQAWA